VFLSHPVYLLTVGHRVPLNACAAVLHVFHFRRHVRTSEIWRQADRSAARKRDHVPAGRTAAAGLRSDRALVRAQVAKVQSRGAPRAETSANESICPIHLRRVFTFLRRPPVVTYIDRTIHSLYIMLIVLRIIINNVHSFTT